MTTHSIPRVSSPSKLSRCTATRLVETMDAETFACSRLAAPLTLFLFLLAATWGKSKVTAEQVRRPLLSSIFR